MLESMLKDAMVDTVSLERAIGTDRTGKVEYALPEDIICRIVDERVIIVQTQTEQINSKSTIWTFVEVGEQDRINGQYVKERTSGKDLGDTDATYFRIRI